MVATIHVWCPNCSRAFYFHKDLYETDFKPFCPYCKTSFRQDEAADLWAEGKRRGWYTAPKA